ncbi:ABC transporter permease [Delftia acidovorans]|jgi:lipopolysaccharide transport system permease protein|uniref:ABC transporter permease n=1 Tax=Delftia acidovorans TaxID=80866 RepID=UPI0022AB7CDE|nr:ABC transporter permease [Delftia acidovorans]WAT86719.1 ABC transporter permease [Delftia acidovorans]
MYSYWQGIWKSRYFWTHLAMSDLRSRWRRSFFGALWSIIQPLGMTALLAVVLSKMFNSDIATYAPYVLSGIIVWEFIAANVTGGSLSFVQADAYIRQCKHPLAIYTLRTTIGSLAVLALASVAVYGWSIIVMPQNFGWCWLASFSIFPIAALIAWPLSTLLAYVGVRFRDIPHAAGLLLQALWFISPVYFEAKMFRQGGMEFLVDQNPVYHLLQLIRAPLLEGQWPSWENYAYSLLLAAVFALIAWAVGKRSESKVIFYL